MKHLFKLLLIVLVAFGANAQDGKKMTFQGSLFQADQPFNGPAELEFTIALDSASTWTETISEVNVINGLYSVVLGETTPLPEDLFYDADERVMTVSVNGVSLGEVTLYAPFSSGGSSMQLPMDLPGPNGNRSVMLSSEGPGGNDGTFRLSDSVGRSRVTMFANRFESDSTGARTYTGAGGAWFGSANGTMGAYISSEGAEDSQGYLELGDQAGAPRAKMAVIGDTSFTQGMLQLSNDQNGMMSSLYSSQLRIGDDQAWNRLNSRNLLFYTPDGGYPGWFGTSGGSGFSQILGYDGTNTATGAILNGFWGDGRPKIYMEDIINDSTFSMKALITLDDARAGRFQLNGNDVNIELGAKSWEQEHGVGTELPYLKMVGNDEVPWFDDMGTADSTDDQSGMYKPDLVWMEAQKWDNGTELGHLTLRSTDGTELNLSPYGIEGWNPEFKSKEFIIEHEWSDERVGNIIGLQNGSQINLGGLVATSDTTTSYGGGFSAGSKFFDGNPQLGYVHIRGTVNEANYFDANMKFAIEAVNHGDWEGAELRMYGNELDENSAAKPVLHMGTVRTDQGQYGAELTTSGPSSPNFALGVKSWEDNGANRPYIRMNGGDEVFWYDDKGTPEDSTDDESGNYHPDLVWMDVTKWENGTELGGMTFRSTEGAEFGINAYGFTGAVNDLQVNNGFNVSGNNASFSANIVNDPNGSDPDGHTLEAFIFGDESPNIQMGGKPWENGDLASMTFYGSNPTSDGWYFGAANMDVGRDTGTGEEWGGFSLSHNDGVDQIQTVLLDGRHGDAAFNGNVSAGYLTVTYGDGTNMLEANTGNGRFQVYTPAGGQAARIFNQNNFGRFRLYGEDNETHLESGVSENYAGYSSYLSGSFNEIVRIGSAEDSEDGRITVNGSDGSSVTIDGNGGSISANNIYFNGDNPIGINNNFGGIFANEHVSGTHWDNMLRMSEVALQGYSSADAENNGNGRVVFNLTKGDDGNGTGYWGDLLLSYWDGNEANDPVEHIQLYGSDGSANFAGHVSANSLSSNDGFTSASDSRYKEEVKPLDNALASTLKLNGYTYFWNKFAQDKNGVNGEEEQIGVIAQELEEVFPQLVKTDKEGFKSVNYASMTAVLIEAVKELNAKVTDLESQNSDLKAQLEETASLESRLAQIEKLLGVKTNSTSSANNK